MGGWAQLGWVDREGRLHTLPAPGDDRPETVTAAEAGWPSVDEELTLRADADSVYLLPAGDGGKLALCDLVAADGSESPWCTRSVLRRAITKAAAIGSHVIAAAELEFFLSDPTTGRPVFDTIEQYGIVAGERYEPVLRPIRALRNNGVPVTASNCEYGGGQFEVNLHHGDALAAADQIILLRSWARQIAESAEYGISFDAKPWPDNSGSGMHFHQSLWDGDRNRFWSPATDEMSADGKSYLAGLLEAMPEMTVLGSPTSRAYLRRDDHSFCPTSVCWGGDNRTVALRVITESEAVSRIEQRDAASDANPYLPLAAQIVAGLSGLRRSASPPPMTIGDAYSQTDLRPLPASLVEALGLFESSALAKELLGEQAHATMLQILNDEAESPNESARTVF
jgi:glutamine synthetase